MDEPPYDPPQLDISSNVINADNTQYIGNYYVYTADGGFFIEEGLPNVVMTPIEFLNKYDVTQALQVKFDVRVFNEKLGLMKDASNQEILRTNDGILRTTYDPVIGHFPIDEISLTGVEFAVGMSTANVLSVGRYHRIYSDFQVFLNKYFGNRTGFTSLFTIQSQIDIHNGIFDASALMLLMKNKIKNEQGEYVHAINGEITIKKVNAMLRFAKIYNTFNNRESEDITIADGFLENDLIFVPTGTSITLKTSLLSVDPTNVPILNTAGQSFVDDLIFTSDRDDNADYSINDYYTQTTTVTTTEITRVIKVPLFIKMANLSTTDVYNGSDTIYMKFTLTLTGVLNPTTDTTNIMETCGWILGFRLASYENII